MIVTLQATGHSPFQITAARSFGRSEYLEGDRRGVSVELFDVTYSWVAVVHYLTTWGTERPFTWVSQAADLNSVAAWVREVAAAILPPGAGFPATPQFETRQAKLAGMMQTLTLTALGDVLRQIHEDKA